MRVVRDGAIESLHDGHVSVVDPSGRALAVHGDADVVTYPRSAVKPFQAAAVLGLLAVRPPTDEVAVMAASHVGALVQQQTVVRVLERAGLTTDALRCPPALPADVRVARRHPLATRLAHNCSGKHAGFLLATVGCGADPARYLVPHAPVQVAVREVLAAVCVDDPRGPGVDGCGAPAWRLRLAALARAFALLADAGRAEATEYGPSARAAVAPPIGLPSLPLGTVATAMRRHPDLIGGDGVVDTMLMRAEPQLVAKRGAEGTLALAVRASAGPVGVAVKVADGAARALGPVAVAVLDRLGLRAPAELRRPAVLGGGVAHGAIEVAPELDIALRVLT